MKQSDRIKYITILIALISWGIYFTGFQTIAAAFSIISIFIISFSVHKNGKLFTIAVFVSFITVGFLIDLPLHGLPPALICLPLFGIILSIRTWFFEKMYLYVLLPLEAVSINIVAVAFVILGYLEGYTWQQWVIGGVPVLLYALFSVIIYKDRNDARIRVSQEKSKQGSVAPDFTLFDQNGNSVSLKELLVKNHLLLIFVRGDWCPTCHVMLRGYYKNKEQFAEKNIRIVGIGPDPQGVNKDIMSRIDENSLMLSDVEQGVSVQYSGALQANNPMTKNNYKNGIPLPASFLVHQNGMIIYTSRSDKAAEVLQPDKIFEVLTTMERMIWILTVIATVASGFSIYLFFKNKKKTALSQSQSKDLTSFQTIVDHTNDALFVIEIIDGKLLYINQAAAALTGYSQTELMSKTYFDLLPKEFLHKSAEKIADVWENKGLVFSDIPHLHKNGELIMVECSAKTGSFEDHPAIVIYARDIRERLKYEHAIKEMNSELTQKNKDITDSIRYALRIQQAILPEEEQVQKLLPEHFILYKPKDIVSGDFYFVDKIRTNDGNELIGLAVADCTGHGVPGAFMTMLGNSFLKQSLTEPTVNKPCEAIEFIDRKLQEVLKYKEKQSFIRDGMDISFGVITADKKTLYFAAANHVAYILHSDKRLTQLKGDRQAVGQLKNADFKYTTHTISLTPGDRIYFFTDGYADQFGGPKGKKFKYKQLEEILASSMHLSMNEQKMLLDKTIEEWKFWKVDGILKEHEQVDDILLIGVAV